MSRAEAATVISRLLTLAGGTEEPEKPTETIPPEEYNPHPIGLPMWATQNRIRMGRSASWSKGM